MLVPRSQQNPNSGDGDDSLVAVDRFIQATRDSGYRGTPSAVAELVDNALQAGATRVLICVEHDPAGVDGSLRVEVTDNGCGMDEATVRQALRFGGTTRFNDRKGLGRYGMGLPNSSLSQSRRVDVCTWRSPAIALATSLDVDEISAGRITRVPKPTRVSRPSAAADHGFDSGTSVVWTRCDRLDHRRPSTIAKKLRPFLGRVFRYFLWDGISIEVNGEIVQPIDPLFLHERSLTHGGRMFGAPLDYDVELPLSDGRGVLTGSVTVRFAELPVEEWHRLSNDEKHRLGISKAAGVSVVRARREIEYGWFFMGEKRKENYDDWWRCEVRFDPSLDEAFGITHTKQQIRPTGDLLRVLVPDLEATAKALNRRVRQVHERLKVARRVADSEAVAASREHLLPPLPHPRPSPAARRALEALERRHPRLIVPDAGEESSDELRYDIIEDEVGGTRFFRSFRRSGQLVLTLNTDHPFYRRLYRPLSERDEPGVASLRQQFDLFLLAAARSEAAVGVSASRRFLDTWSNSVATFLRP
jgi:hypothetical protein